jgi:antirestriction protein ArdC
MTKQAHTAARVDVYARVTDRIVADCVFQPIVDGISA